MERERPRAPTLSFSRQLTIIMTVISDSQQDDPILGRKDGEEKNQAQSLALMSEMRRSPLMQVFKIQSHHTVTASNIPETVPPVSSRALQG